MSVSPFFVNYGSQAREYSLWVTLIAVTSALLLRALRNGSPMLWAGYAVAMTVGLYSELLMIFVLMSHVVYVAVRYGKSLKTLVAVGLSEVAALILFLPWIVVCVRELAWTERTWASSPYPLYLTLEKWVFNIGAVFFDAEYANVHWAALTAVMLVLLFYSIVQLFRDETPVTKWFLTILGLVSAVPQLLIDLATHGHASAIARYQIPLWVALLLVLAIFIGRRLVTNDERYVNPAWCAVFCVILAISALSTAINSRAVSWWDNDDIYPSTSMAAVINAGGAAPLVLSEKLRLDLGVDWEVLVMSHYLSPSTRFLLFDRMPPFPLPNSASLYLLAPSKVTLAKFSHEPQYRLRAISIAPLGSALLQNYRKSLEHARVRTAVSTLPPSAFLYRIQEAAVRYRSVIHGLAPAGKVRKAMGIYS